MSSRGVSCRAQARGQSLVAPAGRWVPRRPLGIRQGAFPRGRPLQARRFVCCASDTANKKLISSSDIPLLFPRTDFALQLYRWAKIEAEANGLENFGAAFSVCPTMRDPDAAEDEAEIWGFDAYVLRDGLLCLL